MSIYEVTCLCGNLLYLRGREGVCPQCQRQVEIQWRADYKPTEDTKTISETLEEDKNVPNP